MRLSYLSLLPTGQGRPVLLPFITTTCRTLPSPSPYLTSAFPPTALQTQGCHQPRGSPWPNPCSDTGWLKADILESFLSPCSRFPRLTQVLLTIPPVCLWSPSIFLLSATPPQITPPLPLASQVAATPSPVSLHLTPSPIQFPLHVQKPSRNSRLTLPPPILNASMVPMTPGLKYNSAV